jgi:hypothetical protein
MAQRSRSNFKSTYNAVFADNTVGAITAANERDFMTDAVDSFGNVIDDGQGVLIKKVAVSSAELLNIYTAPKELVPAPGANKFINVLGLTFRYDYNSIAYATNTTVAAGYDSSASGLNVVIYTKASFINQLSDETVFANVYGSTPLISSLTSYVNKNFGVSISTGNPTAGNGTLQVIVVYTITDIS